MGIENRISDFRSEYWHTFSAPGSTDVSFALADGGVSISTGPAFAVGKWIFETEIAPRSVYDFSVLCVGARGPEDVYVILTQYTSSGKMYIREHAHTLQREGMSLRFSDKIETGEDTTHLTIELWCKGKEISVIWKEPTLSLGTPPPPRIVRIAATHIRNAGKSIEEGRERIKDVIERCALQNADIIVLGEAVLGRGLRLPLSELAEDENGESAMMIRTLAKKHKTYIVYNTTETEGGLYYNTSYLFGREGEVIGKYRKTHLPVTELEAGYAPGIGYPVFDLDFGKVGILICYDQFFPRTAEALTEGGAQLICISSAGDMHNASLARAVENGVYLAVAGMNNENPYGWGATRIVNPLGTILSDTDEEGGIAFAEVDLSARVRRHWMSTGPALSDVHDDYLYEKNSASFE